MLDRYREILAHNADGVMVLDLEGRVLYANLAAEQLFAKPSDALLGRRFGFPVMAGESSEIELIQPGGAPILVEMRVTALNGGADKVLLVSLRDVTEQRALKNALREANLLNIAIVNALQAAVAVLDDQGTIVRVNQVWLRFAAQNGAANLEGIGVGVNYFDVCRQADDPTAAAALAGLLRVLNGEAEGFDLEYPCDSPQEKRWFVMRARPIAAEDVRGLVVSHIDMTIYRAMLQAQHDAESAQRMRQQELEYEAFHVLSFANPHAGSGITPALREDLIARYGRLLDLAVEQRAYKTDNQVSTLAEELGEMLGAAAAHPRDLIEIHLETLNRKRRANVKTPSKVQVYFEEGRILVLEIMGYLAAHYRRRAAVTRQPMMAADGETETG